MTDIVYVLTNEAMPDLVKVGKTNSDLVERIKNLSSHSGVPLSFELYYACAVENADFVEQQIHDAFSDNRINPKKNFFRIDPNKIVSALKIGAQREIILDEDEKIVETIEEQKSIDKIKKKRRASNFKMLNIPIGSKLFYYNDNEITAEVISDRKIKFREKETYPSPAVEIIFLENNEITESHGVNGNAYWEFEGETLWERRLRLEDETDED